MMEIIKRVRSRVDSFYLFFAFFAIILSLLFFYLLQGDRNIRHYDEYRQILQEMDTLEHQWDSIFFQKYRYIDHDETSRISKALDEMINSLRKSALRDEFGEHIYDDFKAVGDAYDKKRDLLIRFEALNANLTNSLHTMYDLRKMITLHYKDDPEKLDLVNTLFFNVGQIYMEMPYDKVEFYRLIGSLKVYMRENKLFQYLFLHLENFAVNVKKMKGIIEENSNIKLAEMTTHLSNDMSLLYNNVREEQEMIGIGFFALAFLFLLLLIFSYARVKKAAKELLAFRYAIENSANAIVITDTDRHIQYVNDAFEVQSGYKKEEIYGENPNIFKSNLVNPEVYKNLNETLDRGEKWQGELINRRKDGSLLYEKVSIIPIVMDGELIQYLAIKLDVTEYIQQQKILQQAATVYESIGDGIIITDENKKIISVNPAFSDHFGYSEKELLGKEPMIIMSLKEDEVFYKKMWYTLLSQGRWSGRVENRAKNGKSIPVWLTIAVVKNDQQEIQNYIAIYTNLEEIIEMEAKAEYLAYHDSLTKLPNRVQFERQITDVLELAKLSSEKVAILFIDLDRFKVINDTLGHHIGDGMLITLAERMKSVLKKDDMLARIGGDEFVVILNAVKDKACVSTVAERILSVIREPIAVHGYHLYTTASLGIAMYPEHGEYRNEIIKHADSAMYYAKEKGKDNYQFYTEQLSLDVESRLSLEQELLHAPEKEELLLYYQPQYDLQSGKISGAEALLRWKSEKLGWISPEEFIPIAEETGMIVSIGYFVFEEACKEYMSWKEKGLDIDTIAVNISSIQFKEEDMLEKFKAIILKVGIPAHKIEIEITERFIMEYSSTNMSILEDLRNMGCKISIDDFGTGYSSMNYMKSLALDTIKIDKSFILDLPGDSHDAEVSKAIIALSKSLGYQVVAEGIETEEQENFLRKHKCDIGQGYYFASPMESETFVTFVQEQHKNEE